MTKAQDFRKKRFDKLAAARERERDEHSMISQRIQTLIVMQSSFGAACAFVIEGQLPDGQLFCCIFHSAFLALSQVVISLVTSLECKMLCLTLR